jgi:hypothetical protein
MQLNPFMFKFEQRWWLLVLSIEYIILPCYLATTTLKLIKTFPLYRELAKDFVVSGTASESLYGACESMYKPNMVSFLNWEFCIANLSRWFLIKISRLKITSGLCKISSKRIHLAFMLSFLNIHLSPRLLDNLVVSCVNLLLFLR